MTFTIRLGTAFTLSAVYPVLEQCNAHRHPGGVCGGVPTGASSIDGTPMGASSQSFSGCQKHLRIRLASIE